MKRLQPHNTGLYDDLTVSHLWRTGVGGRVTDTLLSNNQQVCIEEVDQLTDFGLLSFDATVLAGDQQKHDDDDDDLNVSKVNLYSDSVSWTTRTSGLVHSEVSTVRMLMLINQ